MSQTPHPWAELGEAPRDNTSSLSGVPKPSVTRGCSGVLREGQGTVLVTPQACLPPQELCCSPGRLDPGK